MRLLAVSCLSCISLFGQATPEVTTKGNCSPVATGNNNTFNITCGIGKEQGARMLEILNKILTNQLNPADVMKKLDEILRAVNPNLSTKTYNCIGEWKTVGQSATTFFLLDVGGNDSAFLEMVQLNNTQRYMELLMFCLRQIQSAPEWLTPRLFCSAAHFGLGDKEKARTMLSEFDSRTGPAYDTDGRCKQVSDYLHTQIR